IGYHSIRKIPAYKGQGHLPGFYWFSGINQLVPYESRLEMFTLMGFDFDGGVIGVLAQPLMLHFERGGQAFRHVPDFLVWREGGGVTVVDVKRAEQAGASRNRRAFESTEVACQHLGWGFEVRTEPDDTHLANMKWLAGYRRRPPRFEAAARELIGCCADGAVSVRHLLAEMERPLLARPTLFHLLWKKVLRFDMTAVLDERSLVYLSTSDVAA
ncbi:MAG: TnsA-like heteromeric transposase endonuclease subunit, partial [Trueperaceae bacterium]|nr:TnsA-like heteromeric transposase endonuclease subunit [Trueperaceae bacterium]